MKILAIFAHPDDESYGPGGTLAQATHNGHIVSLLTFTHGESGSLGISKNFSATELAIIRCGELRSAAKKLGIQRLQIHNLSDKQLKYAPEQLGIDIVINEIKHFKPDIIITYHENTISGHPDHRTVTNWTLRAVKSVQNPPKLFYFGLDQEQTLKFSFLKLIPINNSEVTHRINVEKFMDNKITAIKCHKTQDATWHQFEKMKPDYRNIAKWEVFVQKWPKPEAGIVKCSLFE